MSQVFTKLQIQKRVEWLRTQGPGDSWFGHAAAIIEDLQAEIERWCQHAAERVDTFERERSSLVGKLAALQNEPTYRIRQEQAELIEELQSRLDALMSSPPEAADELIAMQNRTIKDLESRLAQCEKDLADDDVTIDKAADRIAALESRLQACFELVERPGLTSHGVVSELCKLRDQSVVVERHMHKFGPEDERTKVSQCECGAYMAPSE